MSASAIAGLLVGAVLALAGGVVQRHLEFRRALRVAARAVYDELLSNLTACHVEAQRLQMESVETPDALDDPPLGIATEAWAEYSPTFAAMRSPRGHDQLRATYGMLEDLDSRPSAAVLHVEMETGILNPAYGIGAASPNDVYYETRDDGLLGVVAGMIPVINQVAQWARISRKRADADIAATRPSDDTSAPGYCIEVTTRATLDSDGRIDLEPVVRAVHRRR